MDTPKDFCLWLQGMFELNPPTDGLTQSQVNIIQDHLNLVFTKITPMRTPLNQATYCALNTAFSGVTSKSLC